MVLALSCGEYRTPHCISQVYHYRSKAFICDECIATAVKVMEAHPPDTTSGDEGESASTDRSDKVIDTDKFNQSPS